MKCIVVGIVVIVILVGLYKLLCPVLFLIKESQRKTDLVEEEDL